MCAPGHWPLAHHPSKARSRLWKSRWSLPLALLLGAGPPQTAWAGATTTRIELLLLGVDCSLCVHGLEERLRSLPGAQDVKVDLERGRLSLQVRPGSSVADKTLRSLMRDAGFVVREIRRSPVKP